MAHTDLKRRDYVALDGIAVRLGDVVHTEIADERVQRHSAPDYGCVVTH